MQLNDRQIAEHVTRGGFTGQDRVIAVAVVLAESGGRTDARGDVTLVNATWGPIHWAVPDPQPERRAGHRPDP